MEYFQTHAHTLLKILSTVDGRDGYNNDKNNGNNSCCCSTRFLHSKNTAFYCITNTIHEFEFIYIWKKCVSYYIYTTYSHSSFNEFKVIWSNTHVIKSLFSDVLW